MQTPEKILRFYQSSAWKRVRKYIRERSFGLCQECGKPGWEVHHIVPLTLENVDDPMISLGEANLMLLCTECHNRKRMAFDGLQPGYGFDENGDFIET